MRRHDCMKYELIKLFHNKLFYLTLIIGMSASIISFIYSIIYGGKHDFMFMSGEFWSLATGGTSQWEFYSPIMLILIYLPVAASYRHDYEYGVLPAILMRSERKDYIKAKYKMTFVGTAITITLPLLINLILCIKVIGLSTNTPFGDVSSGHVNYITNPDHGGIRQMEYNELFPNLFLKSPLLYHIVYLVILWISVGIFAIFLLSVSLMIRKKYLDIVLFMPFFLIDRAGDVLSTILLNKAQRSDSLFVNLKLTDYLAPCTFPGKVYAFYLVFLIILVVISIILARKWIEKPYEEMY